LFLDCRCGELVDPLGIEVNYRSRIRRLQAALDRNRIDAALITSPASVRYLCGYSGTEGTLLVSRRSATFFTDFRYSEYASALLANTRVKLVVFSDKLGSLEDAMKASGLKRIGVEEEHLSLSLARALEGMGVELVSAQSVMSELRAIKDRDEVEAISKALRIAERAFRDTLGKVKVGDPELQVAALLEYRMKSLGAENPAFDSIVASGARSALPHGVASDKAIGCGEIVLFDFGCRYRGYCSDLTRIVYMGGVDGEMEALRRIVLKAQRAAFEVIKPGVDVRTVDRAARRVIERAGFGDRFGHGLGHGLGLDVHEYPRISPKGKGRLRRGMVFTVEPGIYIEGRGGVRIEDVVLVTSSGFRLLSRLRRGGEVLGC